MPIDGLVKYSSFDPHAWRSHGESVGISWRSLKISAMALAKPNDPCFSDGYLKRSVDKGDGYDNIETMMAKSHGDG